jgi:hypothetical protein
MFHGVTHPTPPPPSKLNLDLQIEFQMSGTKFGTYLKFSTKFVNTFQFSDHPPTQRVKVVVTEIVIRMSWFGGVVGVWHMWVNVWDGG